MNGDSGKALVRVLEHVGFKHVYGKDRMVHKRSGRPDMVFETSGGDGVSPQVWLVTGEDSATAPEIDPVPEGASRRPEGVLEAVTSGRS
jgi:hypothetical protein